jgi:AcrR family transcriptional regulator
MESSPAGRAVVGRGPKVQRAVHAATLAELADRGYAALTVEAVAARAGVHKTTVYRRWKDRESLVVDALAEHFARDIPAPDTGCVESDLLALARALAEGVTGPVGRALVSAMYSDAGRLPEIAQARRRVFEDRYRRAEPVVARAVERGELPPGTDALELLRILAAPIYLRLLVTGEPVGQEVADRAVSVVLAAARAGILTRVAGEATASSAGQVGRGSPDTP